MLDILKKTDISIFEGRDLDLLIESYSNSARIIQVRGITENAQIIADHTTNADRSLATSTVDITSIPITLTVKASTTGVKRGECYVKVSLRLEGVVIAILGANYITDGSTLQWPGGTTESMLSGKGIIKKYSAADPAAGAEQLFTVPANTQMKILGIEATLVTDATVANRSPHFIFNIGAELFWDSFINTPQTASTTIRYNLWPYGTYTNSIADNVALTGLPPNIELKAGDTIETATTLLKAGDNWGIMRIIVEEWISP